MRLFLSAAICLGLTASAIAQATFEPQAPPCFYGFPVGCGAFGDPEGIAWNGAGFATVDTVNGAGFPVDGAQYGRVTASGPHAVPAYGPYVEPPPGLVAELYIPIPPAAIGGTVTLSWDFYNSEGGPSASYNDGMSIDIVGGLCGPSIFNLAYADTNTPAGPGIDAGACGTFALECLPAGPNPVGPVLILPTDAYIRVSVWNGGDNAVSSDGVIDAICFSALPCIPPCALVMSSPFGPGSLQIDNTPCPPTAGLDFIMPLTLVAGAFPGGWCGGIDISWGMLMAEVSFGFPFAGTLDGTGASSFLIPGGVPSGLTLFANTLHFAPGFGAYLGQRTPVAYTTP